MKTVAEQISELNKLRQDGVISEDEFRIAKEKILSTIGNQSDDRGGVLRDMTRDMSGGLKGLLDNAEAGHVKVVWALYIGEIIATILSFTQTYALFSFFLWVAIVVVAIVKRKAAADNISGSHFQNIIQITVVTVVGTIVAFVLAATAALTAGFGLVASLALWTGLTLWAWWRVIKGMIRLNEGKNI